MSKFMKKCIIVVANQKGGVGKTTTAITVAHGLAIKGLEVLLVDLDPQGQCSSALGLKAEPGVFNLLAGGRSFADVTRTTGRGHLSLIPGDKRTATAQVVMATEGFELSVLRDMVGRALRNGLDVVVFDTAPSVGGLQEAALFAADLVLVPTSADYLATEGVVRLLETLKTLSKKGWQGTVFGILPTFYDSITRESQATVADLKKTFGDDQVLEPIHKATVLRECSANAKTIWEYAPRSRSAQQYATVIWELTDGETNHR